MARTMRHEKPKNFGLTLRRLLAYLKRHTPMLLLISLLVLISAGANVFGTYLLKPVVNRYIPVSYTHLDVSKRQTISASIRCWTPSICSAPTTSTARRL